jgi:phenylpropionate dioxygenase-like ring-hydroxylating dioxygenase large terminal subunit
MVREPHHEVRPVENACPHPEEGGTPVSKDEFFEGTCPSTAKG